MEPEQRYNFEAELWLYPGVKAAWHFVTVPSDVSHSLRFFAGRTKGFGSIRVRARIGDSHWQTSVFPDKKTGCYFLPVKADVRRAQSISVADLVSVELITF